MMFANAFEVIKKYEREAKQNNIPPPYTMLITLGDWQKLKNSVCKDEWYEMPESLRRNNDEPAPYIINGAVYELVGRINKTDIFIPFRERNS